MVLLGMDDTNAPAPKAPASKRSIQAKSEAEQALFRALLPSLRRIVRAGGTADSVLKESEPYAALQLTELALRSEKDDVRLRAANAILDRTLGRPVERSMNVYADISKMRDEDLDRQLVQLIKQTGAEQVLQQTLQIAPPPKRGRGRPKGTYKVKPTHEEVIPAEAIEDDIIDLVPPSMEPKP